jgi:HK97 family phage major capsid protein
MSANLSQWRADYAHALDQSEMIRAKYQGDRRNDMTAEETTSWEKWLNEADAIKAKIDLEERAEKANAAGRQVGAMLKLAGGGKAGALAGDEPGEEAPYGVKAMTRDEKKAWKAFFVGVDPTGAAIKALAAYEGDLGGFLVLPQQLAMQILTLVKDLLFIRRMATVYPLDKAESLGVPVMDTDLSDPTWTSELNIGAADATTPFGKRQLTPHPLAKNILISNKLLRQAAIDPEALVMDRIAYRIGRTEENAFLNGTGANQPLGVMVASTNGISTNRDVTMANATTIVGDDLIGAKYTLKAPYWERAQWIFHRTLIMAIRKAGCTIRCQAHHFVFVPIMRKSKELSERSIKRATGHRKIH